MTTHDSTQKALNTAEQLLDLALKAGAEAADAVVFESMSLEASYRLGKLEDVQRSESQDLGLRVFIGQQQASVSTTDFSAKMLESLAQRAVDMAKEAPEDPYCGLAPADRLAKTIPELDLFDQTEPSTDDLSALAAETESAALEVKGITNSEGAGASWGRGGVALVTSGGFSGAYSSTSSSVSCAVLAGEGTEMEMAYDFQSAHHKEDLRAPKEIGEKAAERALAALKPRRVPSQAVPVIYEDRVANSMLRHFGGAISGTGIARGTSFLKDKMGEPIFGKNITIVDDPHRPRGLASQPFDGEGVENQKSILVQDGVLQTWLLDSATAKQLNLATTGHATRGTGGPPRPSWSNLHMEAGTQSAADLIADVDQGLFVNSMFGPSVNPTTGDYSVGVSGIWIDKGELAFPVNEITIAGNLIDMFMHITPANDLKFEFGTNAPTLRIDGMTVAGE